MAETETLTILRVDTGEAVKSVGDLRDNIKLLKDNLGALEIGTQEYQDTLSELRVNQNALRDAMYATSGSMEDVAKSATGASESYNGLVNRMKALKEEFRSTGDEARRMELGAQIKAVNDQLKEMDAMQGNFQRNVGNYAGSIKEALGDIPSFANPVKGALDNVNKSMGLLSKNPLLGIIALLFPLIQKITSGLKDNKTAIDAVNKAMKALEPVFSLVSKTVETLAGWLSQAVDWFVRMFERSKDTFANIISGAVGVGNAVLQYLLTPIRTTVEAVKGLGSVIKDVFTGNWKAIKEDAAKTVDGIKDAFKKGFSFKDNFAEGRRVGTEWVDGLMTARPKAKDAGKAIGTAVGQGITEGLDAMEKEIDAAIQRVGEQEMKAEEERNKIARASSQRRLDQIGKEADEQKRIASASIDDAEDRAAALYDIEQGANQKRLEALKRFAEEAGARGDLDARLQYEQEAADLSTEIELRALERQQEIRRKNEEDAKASAQERIAALQGMASTVSGILGNLADMYEANGENDKRAARKAKALRIASATIDTIQGAITAFTSAQSLGVPLGPIVGAVNAAAVTTMGLANIAKIRSTNVDGGTASSAPAPVAAPRVDVAPQQTTLVQSASDEERLNKMLADQQVYILDSQLEANQGAREVRVRESSF